jgi:hypothetical protein
VARLGKFARFDEEGRFTDPARRHDVRPFVAAQTIAVCHALRVEDSPDLVRLVTVHAGRNHVGLLLPELAANDLAVHHLNLRVTFLAGLRDVALGDGRARVGVRQDEMRRMTTGANRRHHQAAAKQTLAVKALRVILENLVLRNVMRDLNRRAFVMAAPAQKRNLHDRSGRPGIGRTKDVVRAMTIGALRRELVAALECLAVQAGGVLFLFSGMAVAAIDRQELFGMREFLLGKFFVAVGALEAGVRRGAESRGVKGWGNAWLPLACAPRLVAHQAVVGTGQLVFAGILSGQNDGREADGKNHGASQT